MSDPVAIYAAAIASLAVFWEAYTWRKARQPAINVTVSQGLFSLTDGSVSDWNVILEVANRGSQTVNVAQAGFYLQHGPNEPRIFIGAGRPGAGLPGSVAAQNNAFTYTSEGQAVQHGLDLTKPIRGYVRLATGETLKSKPATLRKG